MQLVKSVSTKHVLLSLLYDWKTWTTYSRHILHLECLYQKYLANTENIVAIKNTWNCSLYWVHDHEVGHVWDIWLPKLWWTGAKQTSTMQTTLMVNIGTSPWENLASERLTWNTLIIGINNFEKGRIEYIVKTGCSLHGEHKIPLSQEKVLNSLSYIQNVGLCTFQKLA